MFTTTRRRLAALSTSAVLAALFVPTTAASADECDATWTGDADAPSWGDPDNWDGDVPGPDDVACIASDEVPLPVVVDDPTVAAGLLVEFGIDGPVLVIDEGASLRLHGDSHLGDGDLVLGRDTVGVNNPSLQIDGSLTIGGDLVFNRGVLTGAGETTVQGGLVGPGTSRTRVVRDHTLVLQGGGELAPTGFFIEGSGEVVNTGQLRMSGVGAVQGDVSAVLRNEGTFVHSNTATNWIATRFDNDGTTEVTGGELRLDGPGTNRGTIDVASAGTVNFARSVSSMAAAYLNHADGRIVGDGTVRITQFAGLRSEGTFDVAATEVTRIGPSASVGTWALDGETDTLLIDGGALRGQDSGLQVAGDVEFRRGSMDRDGAVFTSLGYVADVGGELLLTSTGLKELRINSLLRVAGGALHDGGEVRLIDGAELAVVGPYRQSGGLVDLRRATLGASAIEIGPGARLQGGWTLRSSQVDLEGGTLALGVQPFGPFGFGSELGTVTATGEVDLDGRVIVRVRDADEHDLLEAAGPVHLDGTLEVLLADDADLPAGTRIPIVASSSDGRGGGELAGAADDQRGDDAVVGGTFATTDLPELPGELELTVEYTDDTVFLVVAAPAEDDADDDPTEDEHDGEADDGQSTGDDADDGDPVTEGPPGAEDDARDADGQDADREVRVIARPDGDAPVVVAGRLPVTGGPLAPVALSALLALSLGARLLRRAPRG